MKSRIDVFETVDHISKVKMNLEGPTSNGLGSLNSTKIDIFLDINMAWTNVQVNISANRNEIVNFDFTETKCSN